MLLPKISLKNLSLAVFCKNLCKPFKNNVHHVCVSDAVL